ncbi:hypothetical protein A5662_05635 [Mycobacteriaceae bacterium 1482268.1]|nr:hypothetical protein A5662_05635 [Mycobacteriaceae bacterium 1482268.1]
MVLNDKRFAGAAPAVRAKGLADKAVLGEWVGSYHVDDAQQALTIARELDDPGLLVRSLIACGGATVYDSAAAERYLAEANGLARQLGDQWRLSQILCQQAQAAFSAGDAKGLIPTAQEGRDISDAIGDRFGSRQCRWRLAGALCFQGKLAPATDLLHQLLEEAEADHDSMLRVTLLFMLPHVLAYRGDASAAIAVANEAISSATEIGDLYVGNGYCAAMVAYLAAGDIAAAAEAETEAWSRFKNFPELAALQMAYLAGSALARGDLTSAKGFADDAIAGTNGWYRAAALRTRCRMGILEGDTEQAERDAHDALAGGAAVGALQGVAEALEILASLATDAGNHREAARLFGAADGIRRRTGEVRFKIYQAEYETALAECRNALGENDFQSAWAEGAALSTTEAIAYAQRGRGERKRPSSGWASLTPSELDVVRLVSEGLGNKDIAARLFVSPRTVQSHLTRVYTKLGLTSRVQLAQEAARRADTAQAR